MEVAIDEAEVLLDRLGLEIQDGLGGDGREVQRLPVDINRCGCRQHLEDPDSARAGGPAVAQHLLLLTVETRKVGRLRLGRELDSRLSEGGIKLIAVAYNNRAPWSAKHALH